VTASGLRRYVSAAPAASPAPLKTSPALPAVSPAPLGVLPALPGVSASAPLAERCGLCGADLGGRHGHVVALDDRALRCTCRPCYLLFTPAGAAGGRIRAVPERYLVDPGRPIADRDRDLLQIPVTTAFFFLNSDLGRVIACYPSPAGVTESALDLAGWEQLRRAYPLLCLAEPDVEAFYMTDTGNGTEAYLVPIDACFAVAGAVRLRWRGIDGGQDVQQALAAFRDDLRRRSRPYGVA
jgi:hypothetical protein